MSKVLLNKKYITELALGFNGIFAEGAIALGQALKDKKYVEVLNLKKNDIGVHGVESIEDCL